MNQPVEETPTTPPEPSSPTPSAPAPTAEPSTTSSSSPDMVLTPLEVNADLFSNLPVIPSLNTSTMQKATLGLSAYALPLSNGQKDFANVLGTRSVAPLQATSEGWKVWGAPWYWWLAALGLIGGLYVSLKILISKSFLTIAKS